MAVYVDHAFIPYRGMKMCHLLADTEAELLAMVDRIGLARRWYQTRPVPHFDICMRKRALAVAAGAVEIDRRQTARLVRTLKTDPAKFRSGTCD